ncbi:CapA family protein [Acinetobacter vivianii]|uniref:CapA family protein n=1 Tax=Acinetobacter vivianii TaxID=1776742 RepID=UPI002DB9964A|nr:CapA family protein [Acinetobacter vivianii]MEB6480616.1 CapA family protein [Acinetobacter vivianii]MEB6656351.1 CapA family protein [Acinetobacter vivianii]
MSLPQEIKIISQIGNENFQHPLWQTEIAGDCSDWILVYLTLQRILTGQVQLEDRIAIEQRFEQSDQQAQFLKQDTSVLVLLQYWSFTQTLEHKQVLGFTLFGDWQQAQIQIEQTAQQFGLQLPHSDRYVQNTLQNLASLAQAIFEIPLPLLQKVFVKTFNLAGQEIAPFSAVLTCHQLDAVLILSHQQQPYYFSYRHENQSLGIFHLLDDLHRIDHLVPYYHYFEPGVLPAKQIQAKSEWINIIGDTYFGEFYTNKRKNKGIEDALQRYGYAHSFEKIKHFFHQDEINIANFEAVFNLDENSPLTDKKAFILGAQPKQTLDEFKRIHLNSLCLANNHLKDYGEPSLAHTLELLDQAEINFIGAGSDQQQAHQCLQIHGEQQSIAIFNGYWHRQTAYQQYDFYALGRSAGVASINAILFEQIMQYRLQYPQHKIIVICHWGIDFKSTHSEQEKLAQVLTQIGADLVIGHGAHTIQSIQRMNHKPVIFGIGNGVFNSNGEFEKYQALPYGLMVRINLKAQSVQLYPIFTDNLQSFWQPYPVNETQFEQAQHFLTRQLNAADYILGQDQLGAYIQLKF